MESRAATRPSHPPLGGTTHTGYYTLAWAVSQRIDTSRNTEDTERYTQGYWALAGAVSQRIDTSRNTEDMERHTQIITPCLGLCRNALTPAGTPRARNDTHRLLHLGLGCVATCCHQPEHQEHRTTYTDNYTLAWAVSQSIDTSRNTDDTERHTQIITPWLGLCRKVLTPAGTPRTRNDIHRLLHLGLDCVATR